MRIVLSSVHAWPEVRRGAERYVHELAAGLHRAGHDVRVLATGRPARDRQLGVDVRRLPPRAFRPDRHGELATSVAFGWQCLPRSLATRATVWHTNSTGDGAAAAVAGRVRPDLTTVFTDHGFPAARSRQRRTDARYHRRVVADVDAYVCVSPAAGEWLERDYARTPEIVPPGVTLDAYAPAPRDPRPTLLYAGSLDEPRKHVRELVVAATALARRVPDLQLWLHGPGDPAPLLDGIAGAADVVTACSELPPAALADRYARAWATVLVSEAEAFGMTVVESHASGTPAVVLAGSGGPESLVDHETGAVAPGLDESALAAALEQALDLAARPGTAERCRTAAAGYDWDRAVVPALLDVYRRAGATW